ncbi:MAG: 5-formyltetrahydrofolate cyclo-ligase [Mogibacterium sp.]|nr:5-formyltetrahydrofolate cyclo-ligase [Mogibacterium sp.]
MTEKEKIRKEIKEKLNATSEDYRKEASAKIALNALNIPEMKEQKRTGFLGLKKTEKTVLAYCSVGNEPSTLALIDSLLKSGKRVCLPLCTDLDEEGHRTGAFDAMEARFITSFDDLVAGAYGIPEPKADTEIVPPEEIDIVILPCVGCDRQCRRIGHGAGYYDKYLTTVRKDCFTMALCYEEALADELPAEEHDVPVDAVVTEKTVYRWRK